MSAEGNKVRQLVPQTLLMRRRPTLLTLCRFVSATKGEAADTTAHFRSYESDNPDFSTRGATIPQAARATSAAVGFFEPVVLDGITFYDGGLGANNPSIEAWEEIRDVWKPRKDNVADIVSCFISIGCGDPGLQTIEKSAFQFLTKSLANIATETKRTAARFHKANVELFREKRCIRFNVEQGVQSVGLEEYKEMNKIKNAAEEYITNPITMDNTDAVVERLTQKQYRTAIERDFLKTAEMRAWRELSVRGAEFNPKEDEYKETCLRGTRVELIQQIKDWANDSTGENMFWLKGMAGTGKSTISRSAATIFHQEGRLGASFFFKRGQGDRGNARRLCVTLAAQLALNVPALSCRLRDAREAQLFASLEPQFEALICEPLKDSAATLSQSSTIIILIDALDECEGDDLRKLPKLLAKLGQLTKWRIRIFITSRPELPIILGFKDTDEVHYASRYDVVLHEIPMEMIGRDMLIYFQYTFCAVRDDYAKRQPQFPLPSHWPEPEDIRRLVDMAVPLFIFAATLCRFVAQLKEGNLRKRLASMLRETQKASLIHPDKSQLSRQIRQRIQLDSIYEQKGAIACIRTLLYPHGIDACKAMIPAVGAWPLIMPGTWCS
ncbi:hypothetical protein LTS12_026975 [Elasticomyces elasticus]|nr:hypothetical protein LTS12_026975 [Elasticomyces elasticus]